MTIQKWLEQTRGDGQFGWTDRKRRSFAILRQRPRRMAALKREAKERAAKKAKNSLLGSPVRKALAAFGLD